jgi:hypothetical protein
VGTKGRLKNKLDDHVPGAHQERHDRTFCRGLSISESGKMAG